MTRKKMQGLLSFLGMVFLAVQLNAQSDIFQLMERTDLSITEVKQWADNYFKDKDKLKSSEYKQYQRWLYERNFHLDAKGYFIKPEMEDQAYHRALKDMGLQARSSAVWSELGPQNWTYTSGWNPGVGRLTSVAIHPSDTTIIYVSSPGGGIWKSTNSGSTWTPLIDFVNSAWMNVFHLCIDPLNTSTIYASLSSGGVLKSTNAGVTWSTTGSGPSGTKQVKVHPTNSSIVFAAANNGIWRSTNGGASWTQTETSTKEDIEFNPVNPDIMYASGSSGTSCVWRSTNNGVNWTAITSGSGITNTGRTLIAVSPANPAVVYAVQASGSLFGRLYRSTDSGATYTTTVVGSPTAGTNYFGYEPNGTGTSGQATYDMAICVNPTNANDLHIAGIICWRSTNGGTSFVATTVWSYPNSTGYNHADVHGLEWVNNTLYSVSDGGIYKSMNNAGDWTDLSAGLGIRQFYRIACSKTDPNVITTGAQDNGSSFRRTNGSWVDWLGADGMDNIISPTNAAIAIGTSQYGSIYKTTNSGASRTNLSNPTSGNWVTPLVMHPTSHDTVYGGWQGVFRSVNGGSSFTKISGTISSYMDALAVAPSNTRYIYASSSSSLFRTTDGGTTWTTIAAPSAITSIFVSKNNPLKIWITCNSSSNRVFVSTDGGTTLTNISTGLPTLSARSVVVDEDAIETIYVGMNIGVYYRDNVTNTWTVHGTGLPLVAINEVEIQKSGNKLRVATYGRGVWESDLQNVTLPCDIPANLAASAVGTSSATLNWSVATGAVSYRVEYKLSSDTSWSLLSSAHTSTSIGLAGLASSSSYDWRVRSNCSSSNSNYATSNFTTLTPSCPNIVGLQTTAITASQATLSWNNEPNAVSYRIEYKLSSDTSWSLLSSAHASTSIGLTGLTSSSSYDWRVRSNCATNTSSYAQISFTTLSNCPDVTGLQTTSTTSSQAQLAWNSVASATSYAVDYKLLSASTWTATAGSSTNSITLNSLTPGAYNWRVQSICGATNSNFTASEFRIYCASAGQSTTGGFIDRVTLGSINRTSTSDGGYFNGTAIQTSIKPGTSYTMTVSPGYSGSKKNTYWRVYIDYNRDGDFIDAGEQVGQVTYKGVDNKNISFTVPTSASLGASRIRFSMSMNAYQTSCASFATGEVEDYTVNITNTPDEAPEIQDVVTKEPMKLSVYPNPAKTQINVSYHLEEDDDRIQLQIFDMQGRSVLGSKLQGKKDVNVNTVDISTLGSGQYILQVLSPNIHEQTHFIIQK